MLFSVCSKKKVKKKKKIVKKKKIGKKKNLVVTWSICWLCVARVCLELLVVEDKELQQQIQDEKDLITALEILHEFGVDELPLDGELSFH